jgi:hypothetical protein
LSDLLTEESDTALDTSADADLAVTRQAIRAHRRHRWRRPALVRPVIIYAISRILTMAAMAMAAPIAHLSFAGAVDRWDTRWFVRAATNGWPRHLVTVHGHVTGTTVAFFPLFPLTTRWLADLSGASLLLTAATLSTVTGLTAVVAVWILVRDYASSRAADRATLLFALFPGTFVFSLAYAEGIVITLVAWGLVALRHRRWVLAGLAGALATAAAPVALAFEVSCLWTALVELRRTRDWRPLAAPVLAPAGFVGYQLWLWRHTGNFWAWRLTERGGWHSYLSVAYPFHVASWFVTHPLASTANMNIVVAGTVVAAVGVVFAFRDRQPIPFLLYGLAVSVAAMLTAPVGLRPRLVLDAFPLVAAIGVHLRGRWFQAAVIASVVGLVALTVYSVDTFAVFP